MLRNVLYYTFIVLHCAMYCVAVYFSVLNVLCTVSYCTLTVLHWAMYCVALYLTVLNCVMYCIVLHFYCTALHFTLLTVLCTVLYCNLLYCTVLRTVLCAVILHSALQGTACMCFYLTIFECEYLVSMYQCL